MTIFKTFMNIVKKYKGTVILYTVILIVFGVGNLTANENNLNFENSKPKILIVNQDKNSKITNNLVNYLKENSTSVNVKDSEDAINDALFYRDVNYVIYIKDGYGKDILNNQEPSLDIKSSSDYQASLAEMILTRYIKTQNIYNKVTDDEDELISLINDNITKTSNIEITSKLDTDNLSKITHYFNFASYSILAVVILIVCLVLNCFNEKSIHKRTVVSSMNYKKFNRGLLIGSFMYSTIIWLFYSLLARFLLGSDIFTTRGLIYIINLFLYTFCALTIAMLISSINKNKDAIGGIVNVIALGSAFLCGAFIPVEWLPSGVLKFAHILPAYWYINSNEVLKKIEVLNLATLKPVIINSIVLVIFILLFIILNNVITKKKLKS